MPASLLLVSWFPGFLIVPLLWLPLNSQPVSTLYLAWRYLSYHRIKTSILVASITLIVYLPVGLRVLVGQSADQLTARAAATPLLVGARGSPLELVLNSLYFESAPPGPTRYEQVTRVEESGLARPIPLYVRFRARGVPIVGTTIEYFELRRLRIAAGRGLATIGECVVGHEVARKHQLAPGSSLVSDAENVFDLAGVYPLKMHVVGVLDRTHTADDFAVFADLRTTWIIEGLGHGHQDLAGPGGASAVLSREGKNIVANASVMEYNEIDASNIDSFHFHGDRTRFPITAIVVVPHDAKSAVILRGRYQSSDEAFQMVKPDVIMEELLATVLTVQSYIALAFVIIGLSTAATAVLVFLLSLRLRRREIETMVKIGGSRARITAVLATEIVLVLFASVALGGALTVLTSWYGSAAIRALLIT